MCSLQTSTGTALTHGEEENRMVAAAVDEEDELLLDFCRLAGGEVDELFDDIFPLKRATEDSDRNPRITRSITPIESPTKDGLTY